ncbi:response regulator transcription factor [Hufsiella ginkgonis]|uniref:Response regulator n=1 Tax=Hufsiella ginkgonis TaxID=2695274 RepID=A0A7K1XST7_9SPHI|nr:response regulator transcription factor [Hufsiella ginkgonis]MXV14065.1 response regulator [Hufsiella ginkgonis]
MSPPNILFLEDELQLAHIVSEVLRTRGFMVEHHANGRLGLEAIRRSTFDICVADVMMPFMDGFNFVRELRKTDPALPVLFLTARSQDKDLVEGYGAGGNDYLKKPFSLEELVLRINELLHRRPVIAQTATSVGTFLLREHLQELVSADGLVQKLSFRETQLLSLLAARKNQLLDRHAALMQVWGEDSVFTARTMDVFITRLRKRLRADPGIGILSVRGFGYKLLC